MLSTKVDLTENQDFSGGSSTFMDTPIEVSYDDFKLMTYDQYERLIWWEGIFGRKMHRNQKAELFNIEPWPFLDALKSGCQRCGKPLRVPWKNFRGMCKSCYEKFDLGIQKIPWNESIEGWSNNRGNTIRDLFDLR